MSATTAATAAIEAHDEAATETPFRARPPQSYDAARLYTSAGYFAAEQETLARHCWQFVGTTDQLAQTDAWVRTRVWGVDVFVQNFHGELRGFSNVCQHRGFPIRREREGRGPAICGFHAWNYDEHGVPIGVSRNAELFRFTREERRDMALPPVRVETVGKLVFAALRDEVPPLREYLGRYASLIETVTGRMGSRRQRATAEPRANWKLSYEVTLDEYHVQFVHPESFRADAIPVWGCVYERDGLHSQLLRRRTADWSFANFWSEAARGEYEFAGYKIHHIFPNLLIAVSRGNMVITTFLPLEHNHTATEDWMFEVEGDPFDESYWESSLSAFARIGEEDRHVAEAQQQVMAQLRRPPVFGALEERVAWFHDAYEGRIGVEARQCLSDATGARG